MFNLFNRVTFKKHQVDPTSKKFPPTKTQTVILKNTHASQPLDAPKSNNIKNEQFELYFHFIIVFPCAYDGETSIFLKEEI